MKKLLLLLPLLVAWAPAKDQTLKIGIGAEPQTLDPALTSGNVGIRVISQLFEGLVTLDPKTLEVKPGVAESWKYSKDNKTITFNINKKAKWSNGLPVTSHDFKRSWIRTLDPKTASTHASHLYYITGAEDYNKNKSENITKDISNVGIKTPNKNQLVVELKAPVPYFLNLVASHYYYPVPMDTVIKFNDKWARKENIVSNGPYTLTDWVINKNIIAVKNQYYWDKEKVKIEKIEFKPVENQQTEENYFKSGKLHITHTVPLISAKKYLKKGNPEMQLTPFLAVSYFGLNISKKPLNDIRVRHALSLAIDRKLIVERVLGLGQKPALNFVPQDTVGYFGPKRLNESADKESISKAKKLLAEAGFPGGKDFPKIDILYNTNEDLKSLLEVIQQMWKKNLGIEVGLYNQEWKVFLQNYKDENYHISRGGWSANYPDPLAFLEMFKTGDANNRYGYSNSEFDKLISFTQSEMDTKKRYEAFTKAENILMAELPIIPVYHYVRTKFVSKNVKTLVGDDVVDFTPNTLDFIAVKDLVLVKKN